MALLSQQEQVQGSPCAECPLFCAPVHLPPKKAMFACPQLSVVPQLPHPGPGLRCGLQPQAPCGPASRLRDAESPQHCLDSLLILLKKKRWLSDAGGARGHGLRSSRFVSDTARRRESHQTPLATSATSLLATTLVM